MSSTTTNEITSAFTSAMKIFADSSAQSKLATLTVEAEVTAIVDKGLGKYEVSYLGSTFEATTANIETTYEKGDRVYVIIPNGDFSKNKIILSSVERASSETYAFVDNASAFSNIQENLLYRWAGDELSVNSKLVEDISEPAETYLPANYSTYYNQMQDVLNTTRQLKFSCKLQTAIDKYRRYGGNYGVKITLGGAKHSETLKTGIENYSTYTATFDITDILGEAYNLQVPTLQNFVVNIPEDFYLPKTDIFKSSGIPVEGRYAIKIELYCYGFPIEDNDEDDIFCMDSEIYFRLPADVGEGSNGYAAVLSATNGNIFTKNDVGEYSEEFKTLTVRAYLDNKELNVNYFDCYWFEENYAVTADSNYYNKYGGNGWKILNGRTITSNTSGIADYQYSTKNYSIKVYRNNIIDLKKYKCVLVKGNIVLNTIISLSKELDYSTFSLVLLNSNGAEVSTFNNKLKDELVYFELKNNLPEKTAYNFCLQLLNMNGEFISNNDFYSTLVFNEPRDYVLEGGGTGNCIYTLGTFSTYNLNEGKYILACSILSGDVTVSSITKELIISNAFGGIKTNVIDGGKTFSFDKYGISKKVSDWLNNKMNHEYGFGVLPMKGTDIFSSLYPGGEEEPIKIFLYKENGLEFTPAEYGAVTFEWSYYKDSLFLGGNNRQGGKEKDSWLKQFSVNNYHPYYDGSRGVLLRENPEPRGHHFPVYYDSSTGLITIVKGSEYDKDKMSKQDLSEYFVEEPTFYDNYFNCNNIFPYAIKKCYDVNSASHNNIIVTIKGPDYLVGQDSISIEIPFSFTKEENRNGFVRKHYLKIIKLDPGSGNDSIISSITRTSSITKKPTTSNSDGYIRSSYEGTGNIRHYMSPYNDKIQLYHHHHYDVTPRPDRPQEQHCFTQVNYETIYNEPTVDGADGYNSPGWISPYFRLLIFNEFMELESANEINKDNLIWDIVPADWQWEGNYNNTYQGFTIQPSGDYDEAWLDLNTNWWEWNRPYGPEVSPEHNYFPTESFYIRAKYIEGTDGAPKEGPEAVFPAIAYFPVEIIFSKEGRKNYLYSIPILQGGIDKVLYSKSGIKPEYDESPFYLTDMRLQRALITGPIDSKGKIYNKNYSEDNSTDITRSEYDLIGSPTEIFKVNGNHKLNQYQRQAIERIKENLNENYIGFVSGGIDVNNYFNIITQEDSLIRSNYMSCSSWSSDYDEGASYLYRPNYTKKNDCSQLESDIYISNDNRQNLKTLVNKLFDEINLSDGYVDYYYNVYRKAKILANNAGEMLSAFYYGDVSKNFSSILAIKQDFYQTFKNTYVLLNKLTEIYNLHLNDQKISSRYNEVSRVKECLDSIFEKISSIGFTENTIQEISVLCTESNISIEEESKIDIDSLSPGEVKGYYQIWNNNIDFYNNFCYNNIIERKLPDLVDYKDTESQTSSFFNQLSENLFKEYSWPLQEGPEKDTFSLSYNYIVKIKESYLGKEIADYSYPTFLGLFVKPIIEYLQQIGLYNYDGIETDLYWGQSGNPTFLDRLQEASGKYDQRVEDLTIARQLAMTVGGVEPVVYKKPILKINNYEEDSELSFLWDWDGTSAKVDKDKIMTPLIAAGYKSSAHEFNGMIMGAIERETTEGAARLTGLIGYNKNDPTMFLNAIDGSAIFGKQSVGQIIIDPTERNGGRALLYSSNYWNKYKIDGKPDGYGSGNLNPNHTGMLIDFSTPEIRFGNGNFVVNKDGHVTAAGGGMIAGWEIDNTKIWSKNTTSGVGITIDSGRSEPTLDENGNKVYTDGQGKIYSGSHKTLDSDADGFYLSSNGLSIGSKAYMDAQGVLRLGYKATKGSGRNWTIDGSSTNSYIAYNTNTFNGAADSVYIGTDGISLGTQFSVDSKGKVIASNITATGGEIGGWKINNNSLLSSNGVTTINNDGSIICRNGWSITSDGKCLFTAGQIGNWILSNGALSGGGIILQSGSITMGDWFTLNSNGLTLKKGFITLGDGRFKVTTDGKLYARNAEISGRIDASSGSVGGWTISGSQISANGLILRSDGKIIASTGPTSDISLVDAVVDLQKRVTALEKKKK